MNTVLFQCCLQCFDAVGWAAGRASSLQKTEWWDAGMVMCLGMCRFACGPADANATRYLLLQYIQIGFTFLVLPFWCWLTQVVPDKIQEGRKMVVCVCVHSMQRDQRLRTYTSFYDLIIHC